MIWSMLKVVLFLAIVAGLSWGAGHLLETSGGIRLELGAQEYTLGPLQAVILLLVLMVALWVLLRLVGLLMAVLRFINGDETALSRHFDRNRERRGYRALSDGLMALAAGEPRVAMARATKAQKYLDHPELTTLLYAQAAEANGDRAQAITAYKTLLDQPHSRFVGLRGLVKLKVAQGDEATALKLAEKALAMKPKHEEIQDITLSLQVKQADWKGARATLEAKRRGGNLPKDLYRRREAVLALQEAVILREKGHAVEAQEMAIAANRSSPELIPGAVMAARSLIAKNEKKKASRLLVKAWSLQPHPDLAAVFAEIAPQETAAERLNRFKALTSEQPTATETRLLLAELSIAAEDFPAARRAIGDLAVSHPTSRSLAIMAAIERGEGSGDAVVRGWLARALTAPRGPQWCCDKCQAVHAAWMPVCENCEAFDTLSWREPTESAGPSATGAELLPLIVGAPEPSPITPELYDVDVIVDAETVEVGRSGPDRGVIDASVVDDDGNFRQKSKD